ncbi:MAG: hypothetical protein ACE5GE_09230, partial [Phycisphaerae bacterium]
LAQVQLWAQAAAPIRAACPQANLPAVRRPVLNAMLDTLVTDAVQETSRRIDRAGLTTVQGIYQHAQPVVALSSPVEALLANLEQFLRQNVYHHPKLIDMDAQASRTVSTLFATLLRDPQRLPQRFADRIPEQGAHRVICDYMAGMTDRFCHHLHDELVG